MPISKYSAISDTFDRIFSSVSIAPLGTPVVPEVHIISAGRAFGTRYREFSDLLTESRPPSSVISASGLIFSRILLQWSLPYRSDKGTAVTSAAKQASNACAAINSDLHKTAQLRSPASCCANSSADAINSLYESSDSFSQTVCRGCASIFLFRSFHSFIFCCLTQSINKADQNFLFVPF